jgi:transposase-like protein
MENIPFSVPSEKIIKSHIRQLLWSNRSQCPRCGKRSTVRRSEHRYRCSSCRRPFTLTSGTWLAGMKITWSQLWQLLWCFCRKYDPHKARDITGISLVSIRRWYKLFRRHLPQRDRQLEFLVCADEGYFGKRKTGNQRIAAGVVEPLTNEVRLRIVPDTEQDTLEAFLFEHVSTKETMVYTDSHPSYGDIQFMGYAHDTENHSKGQLKHTVPIERVWSFAKWHLRRMYHHLWAKHLPEFLREIEWRFSQPETFENPLSFLTQTLTPVPTT